VYGGDVEWQSVDAFVCLHPAATCELFTPFNRTIIVLTTTRYDNGRKSVGDWRRWNDRLARIAADDRNVVAANNEYDAQYMRSVQATFTFLFVYEISREPLNGFAPNSHERRVLSLTRTSLNVRVKGQGHHGQKRHFRPFRRPAFGLCLVKHL